VKKNIVKRWSNEGSKETQKFLKDRAVAQKYWHDHAVEHSYHFASGLLPADMQKPLGPSAPIRIEMPPRCKDAADYKTYGFPALLPRNIDWVSVNIKSPPAAPVQEVETAQYHKIQRDMAM
jgi:hypothetical protein